MENSILKPFFAVQNNVQNTVLLVNSEANHLL